MPCLGDVKIYFHKVSRVFHLIRPVLSFYVGSSCRDLNQYCSYWARSNYCRYYKTYMDANCPRSCNKCSSANSDSSGTSSDSSGSSSSGGGSSSTCADYNSSCNYWVSTSQCYYNPTYMYQHCRRACGWCNTSNYYYNYYSTGKRKRRSPTGSLLWNDLMENYAFK